MEQLLEMNNKIKNIVQRHQNNLIKLNVEVWKSINGYEKYQISSFGNVKNVKSGRILKPQIDTRGYHHVNLCKNNKAKTCIIHSLVANAFIDNSENKPCIDHINCNKLDNNVINLRWATTIENGRNTCIQKNNSSGVKGVYFDKDRNKWCAHVKVNYKRRFIGRYATLKEAKHARQNKVNELFGEYTNACEKI